MKALKAVSIIVCTFAVLITCFVVVISVMYPDAFRNNHIQATSTNQLSTIQLSSNQPSTNQPNDNSQQDTATSSSDLSQSPATEQSQPASAETVDYKGIISEPIEFKYNINSADGITLTWTATNLTNKTIKYYTARVKTFNPVGDPSYDQISGESTFDLRYVGPVAPGETMIVYQLFTYQGALHTILIDELEVEYTDGTIQTVKYGFQTSDNSGLAE